MRLIARIEGDKGRTQKIMLEPRLIVRESTAAPKEVVKKLAVAGTSLYVEELAVTQRV